MKYNISIESVPGMHKRYEDHYGVKHFNEDVLVVLADGMGSTDCAKEAAELAYVASNGNHFLTRSISGKDLQGKVEVKERSIDGISSISLETDGKYHQDEQDDATVIRIVII